MFSAIWSVFMHIRNIFNYQGVYVLPSVIRTLRGNLIIDVISMNSSCCLSKRHSNRMRRARLVLFLIKSTK